MRTVGSLLAVLLAAVALVLGVLCLSSQAYGEALPGQEGLPPELVIPAAPDLADQIDALEDLTDYAEENAPETGFIASIKSMFSGSKQPRLINVDDLAANVEQLKGTAVAVEGVYEVQGEDGAVFRSEGGTCHLALAGGTRPEGFPKGGPDGLPARVEGTIEIGEQGLPLIRVQKITPALVLGFIRLGRAYELDEEYQDAVEAYSAGAKAGAGSQYKYAAFARVHAAELAVEKLQDEKAAKRLYDAAWQEFASGRADGADYYTWTRPADAETWHRQAVRETISEPLDNLKPHVRDAGKHVCDQHHRYLLSYRSIVLDEGVHGATATPDRGLHHQDVRTDAAGVPRELDGFACPPSTIGGNLENPVAGVLDDEAGHFGDLVVRQEGE